MWNLPIFTVRFSSLIEINCRIQGFLTLQHICPRSHWFRTCCKVYLHSFRLGALWLLFGILQACKSMNQGFEMQEKNNKTKNKHTSIWAECDCHKRSLLGVGEDLSSPPTHVHAASGKMGPSSWVQRVVIQSYLPQRARFPSFQQCQIASKKLGSTCLIYGPATMASGNFVLPDSSLWFIKAFCNPTVTSLSLPGQQSAEESLEADSVSQGTRGRHLWVRC